VGVVPVVDVLGGVAVRGQGGRRQEYAPLTSRLFAGCDPVIAARRLLEVTGSPQVYVADLDAIVHRQANHALYPRLRECGGWLVLDAGLRTLAELLEFEAAADVLVVASETWQHAGDWPTAIERVGRSRLLLSIDLQGGKLLGEGAKRWSTVEQLLIAAVAAGFTRVLLLDLADVGMQAGVRTVPLLRQSQQRWPHVEWWAGGGVRGREDVAALHAAGATQVLVASVLHAGPWSENVD
jgi:phosphoribosylformimino-5-aminoimidazole carboxamide ribotide isomerase